MVVTGALIKVPTGTELQALGSDTVMSGFGAGPSGAAKAILLVRHTTEMLQDNVRTPRAIFLKGRLIALELRDQRMIRRKRCPRQAFSRSSDSLTENEQLKEQDQRQR